MIHDDHESGDSEPLYRVREVAGHPTTDSDDLTSAITLTVEIDDHEYSPPGSLRPQPPPRFGRCVDPRPNQHAGVELAARGAGIVPTIPG